MWSVKTLPKASVSSAGGCLGLVVLVMAIWVKVVSHSLSVRRSATLYPIGAPMTYSTAFTIDRRPESPFCPSSVSRQRSARLNRMQGDSWSLCRGGGVLVQRTQDRAVTV